MSRTLPLQLSQLRWSPNWEVINTGLSVGSQFLVADVELIKDAHHTDEMMVPLFTTDTDGSKMAKSVCPPCHLIFDKANNKLVQARRNYAIVSYLDQSAELEFDFRVEKSQGSGETVSYAICAPAPRWKSPV